MKIQNSTTQTNFKAINIPKESQRRFMAALREECNADQLLRCVHVLEKEKKNLNHIILRDLGYIAGQKCNGHLIGYVNKKSYCNLDNVFFTPTIPEFLEKLSKKAGKSLDKTQKIERKAQDKLNKKELLESRKIRKEHIAKGYVTEEENCNYLLGEIYKLINHLPKA